MDMKLGRVYCAISDVFYLFSLDVELIWTKPTAYERARGDLQKRASEFWNFALNFLNEFLNVNCENLLASLKFEKS